MRAFLSAFAVVFALGQATAWAAAPPSYRPSPRLERSLASDITIHWQQVPLRQAVDRLAESQRLCIWLDRRLDPTAEVSLSLTGAPLKAVVEQLAGQLKAAAVAVGDVLYVGPEANVRELRTLLALADERVARLPRDLQTRFQQRAPLRVERLSTPLDLVGQLVDRLDLSLADRVVVPHDLCPGMQCPPDTIAHHLTLVLFGFDLAWQVASDGKKLEVVSIERPVTVERSYPRRTIERLPGDLADAITVSGEGERQQVTVAARVEEHEQIAGGPKPRSTSRREQATKQVFSLRIQQQPIGPILQQLARQLDKELSVDPAIAASSVLNERVTFEVRQADLDELLEAACESVGLVARLEGDTIRVEAAAE